MNRPTSPANDDSWENDAVWDLIEKAAPAAARPSFADDVVRLAKLAPAAEPWWKRILSPAPFAGIAAAAAAIALAFSYFSGGMGPAPALDGPSLALVEPAATADPFADIQEIAATETLLAAADHLEDFSDQELVNLVGF